MQRMMPAHLTALALALAAVSAGAAAQESGERPRPRLALVLSGGGARGIAHIGVLQALEEAGIPVDAVAGNSMGAIIGSLYATGRSSRELEDVVRTIDWEALFSGRTDRRLVPVARRRDRLGTTAGISFDRKALRLPAGALDEHRINRFLIRHLAPAGYAAGGDFDRLPTPFRAVAASLDDGERVVLAGGDLARAVRASMSIPVFFPWVEIDGRRLVDGLLVDNFPVDVGRSFGAAVVVGVDVGSPPLTREEYESAVGVAGQVSRLLTDRRNRDFAEEPDVLVRPDLGRHATTDYSDLDGLVARGYEAAKAAIPGIRARLEASGVALPAERRAATGSSSRLDGTPIAEVAVRGNLWLTDRLIRRTFNIPVGPPFDLVKGLRAFDKTEATGLFAHTWMEFEPVADGLRVVLWVREAAPNRAEVGLAFNESEKARAVLSLRNRNTLGFGEETELLGSASDALVGTALSLRGERLLLSGLGFKVAGFVWNEKPRYFDAEGDDVNRARFERRGVDARLQVALGRWGLLEGGALFGRVASRAQPGLEYPEATDDLGMLAARVTLDHLDDLLWPASGERLVVTGDWSLARLGATREYWRAQAEARLGRGIGSRLEIQVDAFAGISGGEVPEFDQYRIGGPRLLPGHRADQVRGLQALGAGVSVRGRVAGKLRLLARAGAGNAFASRADIGLQDLRWGVGLGAMAPTPLGPASLELGVRRGGAVLVTAALGWN
jgi:NTE family protein